MSDSEYESNYDSDGDSLPDINKYDKEPVDSIEDEHTVAQVREAVRNWKLNEMDKNTNGSKNTKSLQPLRDYVAKSATLYYDLQNYMTTATNKETNLQDSFYMDIVQAIGAPIALSSPLRVLISRLLERDLVELPFTIEPHVINSYAEKKMKAQTDFPQEE